MDREDCQIEREPQSWAETLPERRDEAGLLEMNYQGGVEERTYNHLRYVKTYQDWGHQVADRKEKLAEQNEQIRLTAEIYQIGESLQDLRRAHESYDDISRPKAKNPTLKIVGRAVDVVLHPDDYLVRDEDNGYEQAA